MSAKAMNFKLWALPSEETPGTFILWTGAEATGATEPVGEVRKTLPSGALDPTRTEAIAVEVAKRWNDHGALSHRARAAAEFVAAYGDPGECRGCKATIYWMRTTKRLAVPFDADGTNHFATCPVRDRFKTNKG